MNVAECRIQRAIKSGPIPVSRSNSFFLNSVNTSLLPLTESMPIGDSSWNADLRHPVFDR